MELVLLKAEHRELFGVPEDFVGKAECFVEDGVPFAMVGLADMGGHTEAAIALTDAARRAPIKIVRRVRRYLDDFHLLRDREEFRMLRTLTASIEPDDATSIRWIEWLGFERDGLQQDNRLRYVRTSW